MTTRKEEYFARTARLGNYDTNVAPPINQIYCTTLKGEIPRGMMQSNGRLKECTAVHKKV